MAELKTKTQYLLVEQLTNHPDNPRLIKDQDFDLLCASIQNNPEYFETRPIIADKELVVWAGNMRLRAAKHIGLTEVPVIILDLPVEKMKEIMIRDNRQNGQWDWSKLANQFDNQDLLSWGFSMAELGMADKNIIDTDSINSSLDSYLESNVKQIVLYFKDEDFKEVIPRLEAVLTQHELKDYSAVVLELLKFYEDNRTDK